LAPDSLRLGAWNRKRQGLLRESRTGSALCTSGGLPRLSELVGSIEEMRLDRRTYRSRTSVRAAAQTHAGGGYRLEASDPASFLPSRMIATVESIYAPGPGPQPPALNPFVKQIAVDDSESFARKPSHYGSPGLVSPVLYGEQSA